MANRNCRGLIVFLRIRAALLTLTLLGISIPVRAANNCPWINASTVSGLLGAPATATYTGTAPFQPGACTFVAKIEGGSRALTVNVEVASEAANRVRTILGQCAAGPSRIDAIGNEAWLCEVGGKKGARSDLVVGRVRDQVFSITIGSALKNDPGFDPVSIRSAASTAAEQVSGNLF